MIFSNSFSEHLNEGVVVYRQNPIRRNLFFTKSHKNKTSHWTWKGYRPATDAKSSYFLSLPYVFFSIHYRKSKGLFYNKPYGLKVCFSTDENLKNPCFPPLPNIQTSLDVCVKSIRKGSDSLESLCDDVILRYWQTQFNGEIDCCLRIYYEEGKYESIDVETWEKRTKKHPDWILGKKDLISHPNFKSDIKRYFFGERFKKMVVLNDDDDSEQRRIAYQEYLNSTYLS